VLLFILALALYLYQMLYVAQPLYWRTLHGIATLSYMLLGLCLWLTAHWRLTVFRNRRFVPFLLWLKNLGRFPDSPTTMLLAALGLLFAAVSADAAQGGLSAIPAVELPGTDLSVQMLDRIFGPGLANLAKSATGGSASGSGGPTLIYALLGYLNSACAVAIAWLAIMTVLLGSVGGAHEGKSLASRYNSPLVPIRFAFSFAAIIPVFQGMSALQILILAGIGISINTANVMFRTGLEYVERFGVVTADVPAGVAQNARVLAAGAMRSRSLQAYLAKQSYCDFPSNEGEWRDAGKKWIYIYNVPEICDVGNPYLQPGDLGSISFEKADTGYADEDAQFDELRKGAFNALAYAIYPAGDKLGEKTFTYRDYAQIFAAANTYTASVANGLGALARSVEGTERSQGMKKFVETGATQGWMSMGSYYWVISQTNARTMELMSDSMTYSPPNMVAVASTKLLYTDWSTYAEPNLHDVERAILASSNKRPLQIIFK
jgi:hypothetical protein